MTSNQESWTDLGLTNRIDASGSLFDEMARSVSFEALNRELTEALKLYRVENKARVVKMAEAVFGWEGPDHLNDRALALIMTGFYFQRIGFSHEGIRYALEARRLSEQPGGMLNARRRANNVLAGLYMDHMNFVDACLCLEQSIRLAYEQGDPFLIGVAYATAGANLKEMGCYKDAMRVIDKGLEIVKGIERDDKYKHMLFTNASNGLFSADRLDDEAAAMRYMSLAIEGADSPAIDVTTRAAFEFTRASYLVRRNDHETAEMLVAAARQRCANSPPNQRMTLLLSASEALCDAASGEAKRLVRAKRALARLHEESKRVGLYHDDILRCLVTVYGRGSTTEDLDTGLRYARELVVYTAYVKRSSFHKTLERTTLNSDSRPTDASAPDEMAVLDKTVADLRGASLSARIRTGPYETAENWAMAAEVFDEQNGDHCFRVGRLSSLIASELGKDPEYCVRLEHAARLHDIGKITIDKRVLMRAGSLTAEEWAEVKSHCEVGAHLLSDTGDETLDLASSIAKYHHEWWNGTGYPTRLSGDQIPIEARIVALADVYDALSTARPYKKPWSHRVTIQQMVAEMGSHFDPALLKPLLAAIRRFVSETNTPTSKRWREETLGRNTFHRSRQALMEAVEMDGSGG